MGPEASFGLQDVVILLAALSAELDRQKDAIFACLHLTFEGKFAAFGRLQGSVKRPPLTDKLMQFESKGMTAIFAPQLTAQGQPGAQGPLAGLDSEAGLFSQLRGGLQQGEGFAAAVSSIFGFEAEGVFQPTGEGVGLIGGKGEGERLRAGEREILVLSRSHSRSQKALRAVHPA